MATDRATTHGDRKPTIAPPPGVVSIMVVAAHPDDIESWCAGTLARAIDAGATVRLLLVTSGDKGSSDPADTAATVAACREAEALEADRRLGLAEIAFLRHPDGEVEDTRALRADLVALVRRWRPDALFTHDPERPWPPPRPSATTPGGRASSTRTSRTYVDMGGYRTRRGIDAISQNWYKRAGAVRCASPW